MANYQLDNPGDGSRTSSLGRLILRLFRPIIQTDLCTSKIEAGTSTRVVYVENDYQRLGIIEEETTLTNSL